MRWIEGHGTELPKGTLAWVEHPVHGVVWAVKDFYTDHPSADDHDSEEKIIWTWCAYGLGEVFELTEAVRYQVVSPPGSASEQWLSRQELTNAVKRAYEASPALGQAALYELLREISKL